MNANLSHQFNDGFGEEFGHSASILAAEAFGQTLNELAAPITPILRFFYKGSFRSVPETAQRSSPRLNEPGPADPPAGVRRFVEPAIPEVEDDFDSYPPHTHWGINE
jgi:hypothetical protein